MSIEKKNKFEKLRVQIKLASPELIDKWSSGDVTTPETLNYRSSKPQTNGLFCAKIFGPIKDYQCLCEKYKGIRFDGITCDRCGVLVTKCDVRRRRMGVIRLPIAIFHPWFFRNIGNKVSLLLNLPTKSLIKIANLESYIVLKSGNTKYAEKTILSKEEVMGIEDREFLAETGASAIEQILNKLNLKEELERYLTLYQNSNSITAKKHYRAIVNLCKDMIQNNINPSWMILRSIPVIPADLRPLVEIASWQFVSSDLNILYKTIISRVKRLNALLKNNVIIPLIIENESRMLQKAVNDLMGWSKESPGQVERSLAKRLAGKDGLLRRVLLGKRVDFSGRSVIVLDSTLGLNECVIPRKMALELLKPKVMSKLKSFGFADSIKAAKQMIKMEKPEVWDVLNDLVKNETPFILLNRAPTLHKLGFLGFYMKLWDKNAIAINAGVCVGFNADFDGDTMAVHIPHSIEAQMETAELVLADKNLGSVASGKCIISVAKDIALGLYALTVRSNKVSNILFSSLQEVELALFQKLIDLNENIDCYIKEEDAVKRTTMGTLKIWQILPKGHDFSFDTINIPLSKSKVDSLLIRPIRQIFGDKILTEFYSSLKNLGFEFSAKYGASIGKDDFLEIDNTKEIIDKGRNAHIKYTEQYVEGYITQEELDKKSKELWHGINETANKEIRKKCAEFKDPFNPILLCLRSEARGSITQLLSISFMKGSVVGISGRVEPIPVLFSYKNGLSPFSMFSLGHQARKFCTDIALKTAESGYLTRKLVDASHNCTISCLDCETTEYITLINVFNKDGILESDVYDRALGRVTAIDIIHPLTKDLLIQKNCLLDDCLIEKLQQNNIVEIPVRSPTLCLGNEFGRGICIACYGQDIAKTGIKRTETNNEFIELGSTVGIMAAQSISEPTTQLTLLKVEVNAGGNKFSSLEKQLKSPFAGVMVFSDNMDLFTYNDKKLLLSRNAKIYLKNVNGMNLAQFDIPYGATITINNGQHVEVNDIFCIYNASKPILAEFNGFCKFSNLLLGINAEYLIDEFTKKSTIIIVKSKSPPFLILKNDKEESTFFLPENTVIQVADGEIVQKGKLLAYTKFVNETTDLLGGLHKVIAFLENREPNQLACLAPCDGVIMVKRDKKTKNVLSIIDEKTKIEYEIPTKDLSIIVQNKQFVRCGDKLTVGEFGLQDILSKLGINALIEYFVNEIQSIYREQGLKINDKHLEVILHQMCEQYEIIEHGDSEYLEGDKILKSELLATNKKLISLKKKCPTVNRLISGVTAVALNSESFLSAASFQEAINILSNAAIHGKIDNLEGMKENIITGQIIPAGTGIPKRILDQRAYTALYKMNKKNAQSFTSKNH